ncbi:MAG: serine/threonine-protein kinase [Coleofasciculus sp. B1-GNL1-01]|uniref:serine/threonine protein kinase n=1 Tax=Coleofasciculus sp. B1-GNL1-01 TaxID=3068484 RepID=UPI0032F61448
MLNPQQIINGRYQLRQQLGQNAGRQTWLAEDLETQPQELVVIKLLAFSPQMQWEEFRLFEREAQILQHLDHPKIPRYRDYFSIEETESELPWFGLVQQYIPGLSLRQRLDQGHNFSEAEAQKIATDILTILIYLHELSPPVLHRDIKPSNLIVDEQGQVYLVDFGAVQDRAKAEGATFTVVGTSGYAAPEQLWGRAVAASDLYSLGATLIHLITGIAPADLPQQNLRLQFTDRVNLNPRFSYWLEKLIDPATEQRFSSARQALESLTAAVAPENSTNQPSISPGVVFSVIAVLIAVVAGGMSVYFPIANYLTSQQSKTDKEIESFLSIYASPIIDVQLLKELAYCAEINAQNSEVEPRVIGKNRSRIPSYMDKNNTDSNNKTIINIYMSGSFKERSLEEQVNLSLSETKPINSVHQTDILSKKAIECQNKDNH